MMQGKLVGSVKSSKSIRSVKSSKFSCSIMEERCDLGNIVVDALKNFGCPINVAVNKVYKERTLDASKIFKLKKHKETMAPSTDDAFDAEVDAESDESTLKITAHYDHTNRLVEVSINKYRFEKVPREVIQVLGFVLPNFVKLTKFSIKNSRIDKYIIPEVTKLLVSHKYLTDISLDSSSLAEGNYDVLLSKSSALKNLSLCNCKINDEVCKRIVSNIHFTQPAETMLRTLNLSSNNITDRGAKYIAEALRSNRCLRYLNISDNHMTDEGAREIFYVLKEFPLTCDEILSKRKLMITYLKNKIAIYNKCLQECVRQHQTFYDSSSKKLAKSKKRLSNTSTKSKNSARKETTRLMATAEDWVMAKAELMAEELVGPFQHPFSKTQITIKDGYEYCKGNFVLCYLNLAYNNLTFPSLKTLLEVLHWQKLNRTVGSGLVKVVLDGNNLPVVCAELDNISSMLRQMTRTQSKAPEKVTGRSKASRSIPSN